MPKTGGSRNGATVAVAIDRDKNSQHAVRWAVENLPIKSGQILLIHVAHVQDNSHSQSVVPKEGHPHVLAEMQQMTEMQQFFLPYRGICARKGIQAKEVILQDLDVAHAIAEYITHNFITTIVLGASTRNALARAFKNQDVPSSLTKCAPEFCSIYSIARGRVLKLKSASQPATPRGKESSRQSGQTGSSQDSPSYRAITSQGGWRSMGTSESSGEGRQSISSSSSGGSSERLHDASQNASPKYFTTSELDSRYNPSHDQFIDNISDLIKKAQLVRQPGSKNLTPEQSLNNSGEFSEGRSGSNGSSSEDTANQNIDFTPILHDTHLGNLNLHIHTKANSSEPGSSNLSGSSNYHSPDMSIEQLDFSRSSDASRCSISSQNAAELDSEMKNLKLELKHTLEMYKETCRQQAREIDQLKTEEACKLEEAKEAREAARAMVEIEKQKCKAAFEVARMAQQIAELETEKRKYMEKKFMDEAREKKIAQDALARSETNYRRYSLNEIKTSTDYFSPSNKIGEGGYGPVYKAYLDHTAVAIKVLRPDISQGQTQFQQELDVLSRLRHPNVVLLLGACPEYGCLVYEYMEYGSLEDRLFCKNNSPPIPWPIRFRIAAEIAAAIHFFHQTRPEPIVHRDLKPANILLDSNYKSKIGDVGLARLVPASVADSVTQYLITTAAGTFCYIDPEYQQTGMLNPKSDIYSLGVMLLQIITARPPMGLTHHVERSIRKGNFDDILDPSVNNWPLEEALSFANLALKCCELRRKDRPDLGSVILPELERLRAIALDYRLRGRFALHSTSSQESLAVTEVTTSSNSDN